MQQYTHSPNHGWFLKSNIRAQVHRHIQPSAKRNMLEIGSFEGLSACFFSDTMLAHQDSTLDCVDPYLRFEDNDQAILMENNDAEATFRSNIAKSQNAAKVTLHTTTSDAYFAQNTDKQYDFIYIDGCHIPEYARRDMENGWACLRSGGIMWMDDYMGGAKNVREIKKAMDAWMVAHKGEFKVIWKRYQLALRKL